MAIRLVTGNPGAGKSFYLVRMLLKNYYVRDDHGVYRLKDGVNLFCNIDGFKPEHQDLGACVKAAGGVSRFFTDSFMEKLVAKYPSPIIVIDECQRYFDEYFRDKDVIYCFEYHRHRGIDFFLSTQSKYRMCRAIRELAEVEIRGVRRSLSLFGEFKYKHMVGDEVFKYEGLKKDKSVFSLYQSMMGQETVKIKHPFLKYMALTLVLLVVGVYAFFNVGWFRKARNGSSSHGVGHSVGGGGSRLVSSVGVSDGGLPDGKRKYFVPCDFACVGSEVFVMRFGELVPMSKVRSKFLLTQRGGVVTGVREEISEVEMKRREDIRIASRSESESGEKESGGRSNRPAPPLPQNDSSRSNRSSRIQTSNFVTP